jgi:predicted lipid-binding transport protein (Tim44 family)
MIVWQAAASLAVRAALALARPGGGHTYSRGGGGGGDFGGGQNFSGLIDFVFWLVLGHPLLGIPLVIVGCWIAYQVARSRESGNWDVRGARFGRNQPPLSIPPTKAPPATTTTAAAMAPAPGTQPIAVPLPTFPPSPPPPPVTAPVPAAPPERRQAQRAFAAGLVDAAALARQDPEFSLVLFEDFANQLYAAAQLARAEPAALDSLSPYLSNAARAHLTQRRPVGGRVRAVVVGSLRVRAIAALPAAGERKAHVRITVGFESSLHVDDANRTVSQYVIESWHFVRTIGVPTRPWKGVRTFGCPSCGAPFRASGTKCSACGQVVAGGVFDWSVDQIDVGSIENAPPALSGTDEEYGTDLPTVADPDAVAAWQELAASDPQLTDAALAGRIGLIFNELQAAWSAMELGGVRPFVTDSLFGYLQFWTEAYREQGLRNVVEGSAIDRLERVKVRRDRNFDALTFRVFAHGRDYTVVTATNRVTGGDRARDRRYSEYWTLVRSAAVRRAPVAAKVCPACAAPLNVNMAGNCAYCGSLVTSGDFDWVLSKIEQDDVYRG